MIKIKQATSKGDIELKNGGVADLSFPSSKTRRGRVQDNGEIAPTLLTSSELHKINGTEDKKMGYSIRKLTEEECFILQGMEKEDCTKAKNVGISSTQLYKIAGNGLTTTCPQFILEHIYKAFDDPSYKTTDELMAEKYGEIN